MWRLVRIRALEVGVLATALVAPACRAAFLKGATPARGAPTSSLASYRVSSCSGEQRSADLYVVRGASGLELVELDAKGRGTRVHNGWSEGKQLHFAAYEHRQEAWHYVLPADLSASGKRYEFEPLKYGVLEGEPLKLSGNPTVVCELELVSSAPPPGPAPGPGRVPPAPTTQPPPSPPAPPTQPPQPPPGPVPPVPSTQPPPAPTQQPPPAPTQPPPAPTQPPPAPTQPPPGKICVPGSTQACVGPGACKGGQTCNRDGTAWGPCDCG